VGSKHGHPLSNVELATRGAVAADALAPAFASRRGRYCTSRWLGSATRPGLL